MNVPEFTTFYNQTYEYEFFSVENISIAGYIPPDGISLDGKLVFEENTYPGESSTDTGLSWANTEIHKF